MTFKTLHRSREAFQRGFSGPFTPQNELRSYELAGRQDDFCMICLRKLGYDRLFPQLTPGEIHYCPRRFCEECFDIDKKWRRDSDRFKAQIYKTLPGFVPVPCPMCWKRCWDQIPPILGTTNPLWRNIRQGCFEVVQQVRFHDWRKIMAGKHAWRKELIYFDDEMSLDSDRRLLLAMYSHFPKAKYIHHYGLQQLQANLDLTACEEASDDKYAFNPEICFTNNLVVTHAAVFDKPPKYVAYFHFAENHRGCHGPFSLGHASSDVEMLDRNSVIIPGNDNRKLVSLDPDRSSSTHPVENRFLLVPHDSEVALLNSVQSGGEILSETRAAISEPVIPLDGDQNRCSQEIFALDDADPVESSSDVSYQVPEDDEDSDCGSVFDVQHRSASPVTLNSQHIDRMVRLRSGTKHLLALDSPGTESPTASDSGSLNDSLLRPEEDGLIEVTTVGTDCDDRNLLKDRQSAPNEETTSTPVDTQVVQQTSVSQLIPSSVSACVVTVESSDVTSPIFQSAQDHFRKKQEELMQLYTVLLSSNSDFRTKLLQESKDKQAAQREVHDLQASLRDAADASRKLEELDGECKRLRNMNRSLVTDASKLNRDFCILRDQQLKSSKESEHLDRKVKEAVVQIEKYSVQHMTNLDKISQLEAAGSQKEAELTAVKGKFEEMERQMASDQTNSDKDIRLLSNRVRQFENSNADLIEVCKKLSHELESTKKLHASESSSSQQQKTAYENRLALAKQENDQLQEDLGNFIIECLISKGLIRYNPERLRVHMLTSILSRSSLCRIGDWPLVKDMLTKYEAEKCSNARFELLAPVSLDPQSSATNTSSTAITTSAAAALSPGASTSPYPSTPNMSEPLRPSKRPRQE